jgi:hypothetical protein
LSFNDAVIGSLNFSLSSISSAKTKVLSNCVIFLSISISSFDNMTISGDFNKSKKKVENFFTGPINLNSQINVDPKEVFAFPMSALVQNKASISSFLAGEGFSSYQFIGPAKILLFETNNPNYRGCFTKIVMAVVFYIVLRIVLSILF